MESLCIKLKNDNRIWFGKKGNNVPRIKSFYKNMDEGFYNMQMKILPENGNGYTDISIETIVAVITIVTLYLQTIIYSFHLGQILYFQISITAIPLPSFFILLLPSFLIVIVILFLYQHGKIGVGVSNLFRRRLLISMYFILIMMLIYILEILGHSSNTLFYETPYYTDKIGYIKTSQFLLFFLCFCSPIIITFLIHILEQFVFRRYRNSTALSIWGIIILGLFFVIFNMKFQFLSDSHMMIICLITVIMFILWHMFGCIRKNSTVRDDNKSRIYSRNDFATLVMLASLVPLIIGFAGYTYAGNLKTFKVFKNEQYPYAVVYERENAYYCLRCSYKRIKTGEEWYAPELDILYLINDYELVIEKNGIAVETEKYDIVNLVDKYWSN